jgi:outer membrane protein TolC
MVGMMLMLATCSLLADEQSRAVPETGGWIKQFVPKAGDKDNTVPAPNFSIPPETGIDISRELTLRDLVNLALAINPTTRAAWYRAREMASRAQAAKGANYPTINIGVAVIGTDQFKNGPTGGFAGQQAIAEPYFAINYLILDFGRRAGEIAAAEQGRLVAEFGFNIDYQDVVYRVEKAYFEHQMVMQSIEASRVNLKLAETVDDSAKTALENGLGTAEAVMDAKRIRAKAEFELKQLENACKVSLGEVAIQVGLPSNYPLKVARAGAMREPGPLVDSVDRLIATAMIYRPGLSEKYARVREEEAKISSSKAELYPALYTGAFLGAQFSHNWAEAPKEYASYNKLYPDIAVAITLNYELFDGSARKNRLAAAQESARSAREQLSAEQLRTVRGAWNAYYRYMTAREHLKFATQLVESARTSRDSSAEGLKNGLNTVVESLAAERDLAEAEMILTNTVSELYVASAQIALATGKIDLGD